MHYSILRQVVILVSLLLLANSGQAGGIYKWVDADGNVHYGEHPPPGGAEQIDIRTPARTDNNSQTAPPTTQRDLRARRDKMIQALEADRLARQEKKQKQKEASQKRKMECARARDTLRQYQRAARLYKLDADGNRHTLPDAVKQQETLRLQAQIEQWCK